MATITNPSILIISPFFSPNIGGVESHLDDLITSLSRHHTVYVHTYVPLTDSHIHYDSFESRPRVTIWRHHHLRGHYFHYLEKYPLFQFLYLTPLLFWHTLIWLIFNHSRVGVIHTHGINAAFIGVILSKLFHIRHLTSTHAVYDHLQSVSPTVKSILSHCDHVLCLSQASLRQIINWGVPASRVSLYYYWINLSRFTPTSHPPSTITVLFIGRLLAKKGIHLFIKLATIFPQYRFLIAGAGPEEAIVVNMSQKLKNLQYLGAVNHQDTPKIYRQASILCTPSLYEEGYGRVVMEAVASGLPVLASNLGGLTEALDASVAVFSDPTLVAFTKNLPIIVSQLPQLRHHCRPYAKKHFSDTNCQQITRHYLTTST